KPPLLEPIARNGERNKKMFRFLLHSAPACDDLEALVDVADGLNINFEPPLPNDETRKAARSAWRYEQEGRNFVGQERRVYVLRTEWYALAACPRGPDALMLLIK